MIQLKFMSYILPRGYEKCNKNLKKLRPVKNSPELLSNAAKATFDVLYLYFLRSEINTRSVLEELVAAVLAYKCKCIKP